MTKDKTLSIVLATYNGERFLREQLDSVYSQSLQADEVLAIDDCSTDHTVDILDEYHQQKGLKYVINEKNLRVNANFEKGIRLAKGDYISLCDQDDVWFTNKNETLYNKLYELEQEEIENGNVDSDGACTTPIIVSSRNTFVDEHLKIHHNTELKKDTSDFRDTIIHHLSQGSSMMFNRACLQYILPLPEHESGICYDTHIGYIIAMIGRKYDLHQSLMYYRVHGNNVTASLVRKGKSKSSIKRNRPTSVVANHMILSYLYAQPYIEKMVPHNRQQYVNRIISLSQPMNLLHRLYILSVTSNIPLRMKWYSLKASILNLFFSQK